MVLMLLETPGMIAPAVTATNPAIKAYSMRSCPRRSRQARIKEIKALVPIIYIFSLRIGRFPAALINV
jgi:hypothetical protein